MKNKKDSVTQAVFLFQYLTSAQQLVQIVALLSFLNIIQLRSTYRKKQKYSTICYT
jgi:hypothetical protein